MYEISSAGANRRLISKAKNIARLRIALSMLNCDCLTNVPVSGSKSLGLYNSLVKSLKADVDNIRENAKGL